MSKCNVCWEPLQGTSNVAPCGHCFCESHAEQLLEQAEGCPLCGGPVSNSTLKVVPVEPKEAVVQAALRGLCPDNIILAAHAGYSWWLEQTELTYQEFMRRTVEAAAGREMRIKAKLQEVHDAYKKAKAKSAALAQEVTAAQSDRDELQKKFEAKSREKRQQEEQLHKLLAENQSLKSGWRQGPPGALQSHTSQHDAAVAAAAHAAHAAAAAQQAAQHHHGLAAPPHGFGGAAPVLRTASLHQFSTHHAAPGLASGDAVVTTHTRSIHSASLQRFDHYGGGGQPGAPQQPGLATPGRPFLQLPQHGGLGGPPAPGALYAESPRGRGRGSGGLGGLFGGGGGFTAGAAANKVAPSPHRMPRGAQHSFAM